MTVSLLLLSVIIPIIDSNLNKMDLNVIESQAQLNQSEIRNSQAIYFAHFSNFLLSLNDFEQNKNLQKLWEQSHESALKNMRQRLMLLYISLNDRYPSTEDFKRWSTMNFNQLESELDNPEFIKYNWKEKARMRIKILNTAKYLLYFTAVFAYFIGTLGIILKDKKMKS